MRSGFLCDSRIACQFRSRHTFQARQHPIEHCNSDPISAKETMRDRVGFHGKLTADPTTPVPPHPTINVLDNAYGVTMGTPNCALRRRSTSQVTSAKSPVANYSIFSPSDIPLCEHCASFRRSIILVVSVKCENEYPRIPTTTVSRVSFTHQNNDDAKISIHNSICKLRI